MSNDPPLQLVVFSLGEEEYALPIRHVQEIIRYTEPRSVVSDAAWIRGVIGLRGKIVPIYDLAARLGLVVDSESGKIVIVETGAEQVGVMVDDVEEVLTVSIDQLEEVPSAGAACIQAIAKVGDRLVVLLDPDGILADEREAAAAGAAAATGAGEALARAA
jgi:purine-binding chemotaxis protein CheW